MSAAAATAASEARAAVAGLLARARLGPALATWLLRPVRVAGRSHVRTSAPAVIAVPGGSRLDAVAAARALPLGMRASAALTPPSPEAALRRGRPVVVCDRTAVARLAAQGFTIVPAGVAGAPDLLPPGAVVPAQTPAAVAFAAPLRFVQGAPEAAVGRRVDEQAAAAARTAAALRPPARRPWSARAAAVAESPRGVALVFAWAFAEALVWPVVPDLALALLAVAAPTRWWRLALAATAGSVLGGAAAHALAAAGAAAVVLDAAPLVTDAMEAQARRWLDAGAAGLIHQPLSGVPFKAFALQSEGVDAGAFAAASAAARGARLAAVAAVFSLLGAAARPVRARLYGAFAVLLCAGFGAGLAGVVARWS